MNENKTAEEKSIVNFLLGSDSYDGYWYSDKIQDKLPYWWRTKLKEETQRAAHETAALRSENERLKELVKGLIIIAKLYASMPAHNNISRNATNKIIENAENMVK